MKQKLFIVITTFFLSFSFLTVNATSMSITKEQYKALSETIIQEISSSNLSNTQNIETQLNQLTDFGVQIANDVAQSDPNGRELFNFFNPKC